MTKPHWFEKKLGILAGIAGIVGTVFAIAQWWDARVDSEMDREESRLNREPVLSLKFVDHSDPDFLGIVLLNTGPGQAVFSPFKLFLDRRYMGLSNNEGWRKVIRALDFPNVSLLVSTSLNGEARLSGGDKLRLFGVLQKNVTPEVQFLLHDIGNRLQFSTCYCSVTKECKPLVSPGLTDSPCPSATEAITAQKKQASFVKSITDFPLKDTD